MPSTSANPHSLHTHTCHTQLAALSSIKGVTSVEADRVAAAPDGRHAAAAAKGAAAAAAASGSEWLSGLKQSAAPLADCAAGDKAVGSGPFPEIEGYQLKQVRGAEGSCARVC